MKKKKSESRTRVYPANVIVKKTSIELLNELFESFGEIFKDYEQNHKLKWN